MTIEIIQADSWKWMINSSRKFDHIITDYPYKTAFFLEICQVVCVGNILTFCDDRNNPFDPNKGDVEIGYWIKTPSTKNYSKHIGRFVERFFVYRQGKTFNEKHWTQMKGFYLDDLLIEKEGHQYRKPLSLCERLVRIYTNPGDTILDPFCGEGTILEACQNLGRNAIGIDIDPKNVEICKKKFGGNQ